MPSEPRYPHEDLEYGETLEVAPGVHWLKMPLPFALDHINLYLIEDGDGWTVIDTGWNGDDVRAHWQDVLKRFGGRPLKRAIQRLIQDPLALKLLNGEVHSGDRLRVDADAERKAMVFQPAAVAEKA